MMAREIAAAALWPLATLGSLGITRDRDSLHTVSFQTLH